MDFFAEIFQYRFLSNAVLTCLLCGISSGIIGSYIVSRRLVFLSGGITHSSFGGIGMAYYLGINPIVGAVVFAIASALGIERFAQNKEVREDSAIGMLWAMGMAVGIIFIYLTPGYAPNLMSFLFGNILSVTTTDLWWMLAVDLIIIAVFTLFYRAILYVAFDREYAVSQNIPTKLLNYTILALIAITIVMSIRVVGIVLLMSLLTIPAVTANMLTKSLKRIMLYATGFAALATFAGLYVSYKTNIPSGASTIFVLTVTLILVKLLTLQRKNAKKRGVAKKISS